MLFKIINNQAATKKEIAVENWAYISLRKLSDR